jgi:hypothetical protein
MPLFTPEVTALRTAKSLTHQPDGLRMGLDCFFLDICGTAGKSQNNEKKIGRGSGANNLLFACLG